jgi:O-antigen ligase
LVKKGLKEIVIGGLFLLFSLMHVFVINTRMALFCLIVCFVSMVYFELIKKYDFKKVVLGISGVVLFLVLSMGVLFYSNPFMVEKYTTFTFSHIDKIGKLDEIDHPEIYAYNGLVNRLSIWKSALELANDNWFFGVGASDANTELSEYFVNTKQFFLAKYKFVTHNQFLNYYVKFGVLGFLATILYVSGFVRLALRTKSSIIWAFFFLFTISNLTDDFLNRFDGIGFSSFFYSIFLVIYLRDSR